MAKFHIVRKGKFKKNGRWSLVRRSLNLKSFGMNMVTIKPGDRIPEHDEIDRDQEEVFVVLRGRGVAVIDGEKHPVSEGTFVRVNVRPKRTVINTGKKPLEILIVSAPRTSGYKPLGWA